METILVLYLTYLLRKIENSNLYQNYNQILLETKTHQTEESSNEYIDLKLKAHHCLIVLKKENSLTYSNSSLHPLIKQ